MSDVSVQFNDVPLGVIEKEPQSGPAFPKFLPLSDFIMEIDTKVPPWAQVTACPNLGRWPKMPGAPVERFSLSLASGRREEQKLSQSSRFRDLEALSSVVLTLESVQAVTTKAIWKVKSEPCVNLLLGKWKPPYLPTDNGEFIFPFWDPYWYVRSLR